MKNEKNNTNRRLKSIAVTTILAALWGHQPGEAFVCCSKNGKNPFFSPARKYHANARNNNNSCCLSKKPKEAVEEEIAAVVSPEKDSSSISNLAVEQTQKSKSKKKNAKKNPSSRAENEKNQSAAVNSKKKRQKQHKQPPPQIQHNKKEFNVVLTHCTADFDTLASAVGLAKLWSTPHQKSKRSTDSKNSKNDEDEQQQQQADFDNETPLPTYVVLPRGAHPSVQRFLALHEHLFPIKSLKSLTEKSSLHDLSNLNRVGLVDAQKRDRIGPAEPLLSYARHVTIVDHHVDAESDIHEANDFVIDNVGAVSTMITERLRDAGVAISEAEATLLALGIHSDTGSLCYDSTTARDAIALAYTMEQGASQAAIAEHTQDSLSAEQQQVLTQVMLNTNSTVIHGVTVSTVLLSSDAGFINGLAAVTQDALDLSSSDVYLLALVYDQKSNPNKLKMKKKKKSKDSQNKNENANTVGSNSNGNSNSNMSNGNIQSLMESLDRVVETTSSTDREQMTQAWRGGKDAQRRNRLRLAFNRKDTDGSGFLERNEISAALSSSGIIASRSTIDMVFEYMDSDGNGRIDLEEFVSFAQHCERQQKELDQKAGKTSSTMTIIGRVKAGVNVKSVNLNTLLQQFGGGGHPKASSASVRLTDELQAEVVLQELVDELISTSLLKQPPVGDFMTAPVLSASPSMTEKQVEYLFNRYDVRALPVVDDDNNVIGLVTYKEVAAAKQRLFNKEQKRARREAKLRAEAEARGEEYSSGEEDDESEKMKARKLGSALKGWMLQHVAVVEASKTMNDVESILLDNDVGCIPVVADGTMQLVGMVTRTDLLRQHRYYASLHYNNKAFSDSIAARKPIIELRKRLKKFDLDC